MGGLGIQDAVICHVLNYMKENFLGFLIKQKASFWL